MIFQLLCDKIVDQSIQSVPINFRRSVHRVFCGFEIFCSLRDCVNYRGCVWLVKIFSLNFHVFFERESQQIVDLKTESCGVICWRCRLLRFSKRWNGEFPSFYRSQERVTSVPVKEN
jgi:hypothetical protein